MAQRTQRLILHHEWSAQARSVTPVRRIRASCSELFALIPCGTMGFAGARSMTSLGPNNVSITITCPDCGSRYSVKKERAGTSVTCKSCSAAIAVPDDSGPAGEEDFDALLEDAVEMGQQARGFNEDARKRRGTAVFRTGLWPYRRETEITRDNSGLHVESRRRLLGMTFSASEIGRKELSAINADVVQYPEGYIPLWRRFLPLIIVFVTIFYLAVTPRDWVLNQWIRGLVREVVYLFVLLFLLVVYLCFFGGGMLLRSLHLANLRTSSRHHQARYRLKSISGLKGAWSPDGGVAKFRIHLGLKDGIEIPLYRGGNPEKADEAVKLSSRITGLKVKQV